jgi:hypothetical protein
MSASRMRKALGLVARYSSDGFAVGLASPAHAKDCNGALNITIPSPGAGPPTGSYLNVGEISAPGRLRSGRESERLAVPWKPGNAGGGKGPRFRVLSEETRARAWRKPGNPSRAWRLPRKLDAVAKVVGARGTHPAVDVEAWAAA